METRIKIFRPDGSIEERDVSREAELGYRPFLRPLLVTILDGGDPEHVSVLHEGKRADLFVDDEFIVKRLPRNEAATAIYRANWLSQHPETEPETMPPILGTAVLFSRRVWF